MNETRPPICDYEGSDYQSSFWDHGGREYEDQAEAIALRRLLPERGALLLEIGAGAGRNTPRYHHFERVVLLDYSRTQLLQAQEKLGRTDRYIYVAADAYRLPFAPGLFDAATMIRTLHHLAEAPLAIQQVRQSLKPEAAFILEYANKQNLKAILRYLTRRQSWSPFDHQPVEFARLNFDFHPQAVQGWLQSNQFKVIKQLCVSYFRIGALKRRLPIRTLVGMDSALQWTGGLVQLSPSVFLLARAVGDTEMAPTGAFFRCPDCGFWPLPEKPDGLHCPACGRDWPVADGIYDFRDSVS